MREMLALPVVAGLWALSVSAPATPPRTTVPVTRASPPPVPAVVGLSRAQGPTGTEVTVTGRHLTPSRPVQVFMDDPDRPLGPAVNPDARGSFRQSVSVPASVASGPHVICVTGQPAPVCARFQVLAAPPPTPAPTRVPTPPPTPAATPAPTGPALPVHASPTAATGALASLFPWVLLPLAVLLALAVATLVLIRRGRRRPPAPPPPGGGGVPVVTHRSPQPAGQLPLPYGAAPAPPAEKPEEPGEPAPAPARARSAEWPPMEPLPTPEPPEPPAPPTLETPAPPRAAGGDDDLDRPDLGD